MRVKLVKDRKSGAQTLTAGIARGESLDVRAAQWLARGHWYMMPFRYEETDRETLLYYDVTGTGTLHDTLRRPIGGVQYTYLLTGVLFVMEQCEAQGLSLACVQWDLRRIHVAPQGYPLFMVVPARGIDPGRDNVVTLLTLLANDRKVRFPTEQEQAYQAQLAGFLAQVGQAGAVGFSSASFHDFLAWLMPGSVPPRTAGGAGAGGATGEGTGVGVDGAAAAGAAALSSEDGATVTVSADAGAADRFGTTVVAESADATVPAQTDTQFGATVAVGAGDETVAGAGHFDTTVAVQGAAHGVRAQSRQDAASSGYTADADATIASVGAHMSMESPETGAHAAGAAAVAGGQADDSANAAVEDDDDIDGTVLSRMNTRRDEYLYGEAGAALRRQRMAGAGEGDAGADGSAARTGAGAAGGDVDAAGADAGAGMASAPADAVMSANAPISAAPMSASTPTAAAPQSGVDATADIEDETVLSTRIRDLHPRKPSRSRDARTEESQSQDAPSQDARPYDVRIQDTPRLRDAHAGADRGEPQPGQAGGGDSRESAPSSPSTRGSVAESGNGPAAAARPSESRMDASPAPRPAVPSRRPAHAAPDAGTVPHAGVVPHAGAAAGVASDANAMLRAGMAPDSHTASVANPASGAGETPSASAAPYVTNAAMVGVGALAQAPLGRIEEPRDAGVAAAAPVAGDSDEGSEDETMLRPSARQRDGFVVRRLRDGREVVCHARQATIGRSKTADIHMGGNTNVSRIHATITMLDDGRFAVTDHDSANGTSVGGRALASGGTEYVRSGGDFALADDTFIVTRL